MSAFAGVEDLAPPSVEGSASYAQPAVLPSADELQAHVDVAEEGHTPPSPQEVGLGTGDGASAEAETPPDPAEAFGEA